MSRPLWLTPPVHDDVVRQIAALRYPFPDQTDWPLSFRTLTNVDGEVRGVSANGSLLYPDIVIVDSDNGSVVEIGEVEVEIDATMVVKWRLYASHSRTHPESHAPHFFIYVPEGLETDAISLLTTYAVPHGGLRTFRLDDDQLRVTPVTTAVDPKDHRPT
ncbi:MAG TPA: hypothetical protein VMM78_13120 [Thermomicrobiales bacterium]|nr:hypothetical protein [Thermomicrobiales bacterium]